MRKCTNPFSQHRDELSGLLRTLLARRSCRMLWQQAGGRSRWYNELLWVDDEFDLVEQEIFCREESVKKIKTALEDLLKA